MKKELYTFIYLPGKPVAVPAGIFTHEQSMQIGLFEYGRLYQRRGDALAVDPVALPLGGLPVAVETNGGLYGSFRDSAPDAWGRRVIAAANGTTTKSFSELDYLLASNATRSGNLDFRESLDAGEPALCPPHFQELEGLLATAAKIDAGTKVDDEAAWLFRQGTSMGGARPKCTIEKDKALWLAKFPQADDQINKPRIEFATMRLAKNCGLDVAEVAIVQVGSKDVLLVRRFDRAWSEAGWLRTGFLSSLSLMQLDERDRDWDYRLVSDLMLKYTVAPDRDRRELFRRIVFNILIRNTDDHARNHGFLHTADGLHLSPAYDLESSTTANAGSSFYLAMAFGDSSRAATLANAISGAGHFGLSSDDAAMLIADMIQTVASWKDHFAQLGVTAADIEILKPSFFGPSCGTHT